MGLVLPKGRKFGIAATGVKGIIVDTVELWGDIASLSIEDQGDIGGMMRGVTQEDANFGTVRPLVV